MMKRTHMFMGIAAVVPFVSWNNALLVPAAILGSIAPDWDHITGARHRTLTHSLLALIMSTLPLAVFEPQLGFMWFLNYSGHLLLDSLTLTGVPLFYPLSKKCYGFKLFRTRGSEDMFMALMLIYVIVNIVQ